MPHSKKDIAKFQKLYLHNYGKNLSKEEAEKRLNALVGLLRLVREVPNKKSKSEIKLKLNIKTNPTPKKDTNTLNESLSEPE